MHLVQIDDSLEQYWDDFASKRTATITCLSGWRHVLRESYGIRSYFLAVEEESSLLGGLCLYEFRHPLFGYYLTTAPFSTDGGLLFDTCDVRDFLIAEAKSLADRLGVDYLLIRNRDKPIKGLQNDSHYQSAMIDLRVGEDQLWKKTLPGKTRNQVRRGSKEGFTVQTGRDQIEDFHRVFHAHMRYLGSPAHSIQYYRNIQKYFGENVWFTVVRDKGELAAGAMLVAVNQTAMNLHTVSLAKFNRRCPNYLLYWDMVRSSCERGNEWFDMGRSEAGSSNLKFKTNWGAEPVGLNYNYYLRKLSDIPYVDPRNVRYRLPIALWKKMPHSMTRAMGPWLIRGIG